MYYARPVDDFSPISVFLFIVFLVFVFMSGRWAQNYYAQPRRTTTKEKPEFEYDDDEADWWKRGEPPPWDNGYEKNEWEFDR